MPARPLRRSRSRDSRRDLRAAILAAARVRLEQGGFRRLSIDSVMEDVGLTRTAFYRYFDDLGALVQVLLTDMTRPLDEAAARLARDAGGSDEEAFLATLGAVAEVFAEHGRVFSATVAAAQYDDDIESAVHAIRERFVALAAAGLAERADRTGVEIPNPRETARALNAMNEGYLLDAFGRSPRVTPEEAVQALWPPWRSCSTTPRRPHPESSSGSRGPQPRFSMISLARDHWPGATTR